MASSSSHQRYQSIGNSYSGARRPDPRIQRLIVAALGDAQSVVNVGAGTGNYEPVDRRVVAVEPSLAMIAQRRSGGRSCDRGGGRSAAFRGSSFRACYGYPDPSSLDRFGKWAVRTTPGGEPSSDPAVRAVDFPAVLAGRILPRVPIVALGDTGANHRRPTDALGRSNRRSRAGAG